MVLTSHRRIRILEAIVKDTIPRRKGRSGGAVRCLFPGIVDEEAESLE